MRGIRSVLVATLIASAAVACGRSAAPYDEAGQPAAQAVTVAVENDYALAVDIWAVTSGHSTRLGSVGPGMSDTLVLDPALMPNGIVELVARPTGGGRLARTGPLNPNPGQTVDFQIGAHLTDSIAIVH